VDRYYYLSFSSGGLERVGMNEFEDKLCRLARKCNGEFSGSGFGFGERDYGFVFKTSKSVLKFYAELGRRARVWNISQRHAYLNEDSKIMTLAKG